MSCKYSNFEGKCELFDEEIEQNGCDETGSCIREDEPDPAQSCEKYESIEYSSDWCDQ